MTELSTEISSASLDFRKEYRQGSLLESSIDPNPIAQLRTWLEQATQAGVIEPNAMTVSSVGANGRPSSRVVLLRGLEDSGLTFFTNYTSRKGQEIDAHGFACVNFWWGSLERQVRVEGAISRVSGQESDAYFNSRPYESQLASAASPQSQTTTRADLETLVEALRLEHPERVPRPAHWGGFRIVPDRFEFWQGRPARLHDRIVYALEAGVWTLQRLAP
jgi:pyridoxamine 5'-phosphate oxidase